MKRQFTDSISENLIDSDLERRYKPKITLGHENEVSNAFKSALLKSICQKIEINYQ